MGFWKVFRFCKAGKCQCYKLEIVPCLLCELVTLWQISDCQRIPSSVIDRSLVLVIEENIIEEKSITNFEMLNIKLHYSL